MIPLETIGVALIGYLLGSIPFGVLVSKRFGVDIYSVGSGNPGATNVLREIGKPAGYTVFVFDFLKGFLATYWFMIPVFSIETDPVFLGLWGLPAAVLGVEPDLVQTNTYDVFRLAMSLSTVRGRHY